MPVPGNFSTSAGPLTASQQSLSQRLVAARLTADPLPDYPGELPTELGSAYAIQSASIQRWPDEIVGWKVGAIPPDSREALGATRLAGPIFGASVFDIEPGGARTMPIFDGGFAAIEAEFVFRLGTTIAPVARDYTDAELRERVAALHVGAEIASSPMADVNKLGPCCVVTDFGNNAGLLVGPEIRNWSAIEPATLLATVSVDGAPVGHASAAVIEGGLLSVLRFLIDLCAMRGLTLPANTFVSCGALTGIHDVTVASRATVDFGVYGAFDVAFSSMPPIDDRAVSAKV